jgi:MFS family permease
VLLLAAAHRILGGSVGMVVLGRLSAVLFGIGTVFLAQRLAARIDRRLALTTAILTATSAYFAYWSFGGMEATLCALLATSVILLFGNYVDATKSNPLSCAWIVLAILAFIFARPEHPLVLLCLCAGAVATTLFRERFDDERHRMRRALLLLAISAILIAALFTWRWHTFGSLFPQPVNAKSGSLSARTLKAGLHYYRNCVLFEPGVALFAAAAVAGGWLAARKLFCAERIDPRLLFVLLFFIAQSGFVLFAGGDWMEAGRFFVPLIPIAALLAAFAISNLQPRAAKATTFALIAAGVFTTLHLAARSSTAIPVWATILTEPYASEARASGFSWFERMNRPNLRDIPTIRQLDRVVAQLRVATTASDSDSYKVRIMSGQMGIVAYHIARKHYVEMIDRRGLIDRRFTSCPSLAGLPRSSMGLELDYASYFAHRAQLENECHIPRPDIIFDGRDVPELPDYTVIYRQRGFIETDSRWFPGMKYPADEFIAVRNDLLPTLGGDSSR